MQSATAPDPNHVTTTDRQAEYEALKRDLEAELAPATATERTFAGLVIHATWRIQCCDRIEARLAASDPAQGPPDAPQGTAPNGPGTNVQPCPAATTCADFLKDAAQRQAALDRTRAQATNNLRKALQELRILQTERRLRVELFQGAPVTTGHGLASYKEIVSTLAKDTWRRAAAGRNPTIEDFRNLLNKTNPTVSRERATAKPEITKRSQPAQETAPPPGRNAPCPCHSGQKYKRCCGRQASAPLPAPRARAA